MRMKELFEIDRNISINEKILELRKNPLTDEQIQGIAGYFDQLRKAELVDIIDFAHYYDSDKYDFYFNLEDSSSADTWSGKLIMKSTYVNLVLKNRILDYLVHINVIQKK